MITAILLAAGESKRMGSFNKLLLPTHEEPIIRIVCKNVIKVKLDQVIIVTGHQSSEIKKVVLSLNLNEIRMGMANDYIQAVENNATFLRIGSSIFGQRN